MLLTATRIFRIFKRSINHWGEEKWLLFIGLSKDQRPPTRLTIDPPVQLHEDRRETTDRERAHAKR